MRYDQIGGTRGLRVIGIVIGVLVGLVLLGLCLGLGWAGVP